MDFPVFQGITLKLNDKQSCMVARIFHGGMIHRQGNEALIEAAFVCSCFLSVKRSGSPPALLAFLCGHLCPFLY